MKVIPISTKTQIFEYVAEGLSTRQIAKKVPSVSHMTVTRLRSEHFNGLAKPKAGRPSKLTPYDKRKLVRDMSSGRIQTAVDAAKELSNTMETQLHPEAIRRVLRKSGLKAIKKKKKPFLSRKHRQQRLEFARKYSNWTPEDFKRVIWSDETKINRFGSDGLQWVWKKPKAPLLDCHVQGTFKHGGGSLMLWGCMTSLGIVVKKITFQQSTMTHLICHQSRRLPTTPWSCHVPVPLLPLASDQTGQGETDWVTTSTPQSLPGSWTHKTPGHQSTTLIKMLPASKYTPHELVRS